MIRNRIFVASGRTRQKRCKGTRYSMTRFCRIFMIVILAAFAAGTVANAANAATMSLKMSLAGVDGADLDICPDCSDGKADMPSCDNVCVSPILAVMPSGQPSMPAAQTSSESALLQSIFGPTGPPDPYPPKSIILS